MESTNFVQTSFEEIAFTIQTFDKTLLHIQEGRVELRNGGKIVDYTLKSKPVYMSRNADNRVRTSGYHQELRD